MISLDLLKQNTEIKTETFEAVGLIVENIAVQFADLWQGPGIKFLIELTREKRKRVSYVTFKVNVYDEEGELIDVGDYCYDVKQFSGFDTIPVGVYEEKIRENAAKAVVYVTK